MKARQVRNAAVTKTGSAGGVSSGALPVVDLDPLRIGQGDLDETVATIDRACRETGFFAVRGHGVAPTLVTRVLLEAERFFALPLEAKLAMSITESDHHLGYVPFEEETLQPGLRGDAKEGLDLGVERPADPDLDGPLDGPTPWPDLPGFRETIVAYQEAAAEAAGVVLRGIALALGLHAGFFDHRMRRPLLKLRLLHYPPVPEAEQPADQLGCGAHADYGLVTLLAVDGVPGLEVRHRDGTWRAATCPEGTLIVNIGDLLARWTNDRYVSTVHRVRNPVDRHRYSAPFFVDPDFDTEVACLPTCVDEEHPARYEPVRSGAYLMSRFDATYAYRAPDS